MRVGASFMGALFVNLRNQWSKFFGQSTPCIPPLPVILSVSEESLKALADVEILLHFSYQDGREGSCSG